MDLLGIVQTVSGIAAVITAFAALIIARRQTELADSQASSAKTQTEIAQSLQQLELQRDRPLIVATGATVVEKTLLLDFANAGGGAAINAEIEAVAIVVEFRGALQTLNLPGLNVHGRIPCIVEKATLEVPLATVPNEYQGFRPVLVMGMIGRYQDSDGTQHPLDFELEPGTIEQLRAR